MIKRLARCIREYKWSALVSPLAMVGEVAMEVTIPLVMADLYDYGIAARNMNIVVEKAFQPGGDRLRAQGIRVESLARVKSMSEETGVVFVDD